MQRIKLDTLELYWAHYKAEHRYAVNDEKHNMYNFLRFLYALSRTSEKMN